MKQKYDICAMKYRMLSDEELQALEPELKEFLIVNGLDGEAWEQLNVKQPEKALALVQMFSDIVFEKVYKKVEVLEKRDAKNITIIQVGSSVMEMFHITTTNKSSPGFVGTESISNIVNQYPEAIDVYRGTKHFQLTREDEIHRLVLQGFSVVSSQVWEETRGFMG